MLTTIRRALARLLETVADRLEPGHAPDHAADHAADLALLLAAAADPAPSVTLARVAGQLRVVPDGAEGPLWIGESAASEGAPLQVRTVPLPCRVLPPEDAERAHLLRAVAAMEG